MTDRFELRTFIGDAPVIVHCGEHTLRTLLPLWQEAEPEHTVAIDLKTGGKVVAVIHDEITLEFDTAEQVTKAAEIIMAEPSIFTEKLDGARTTAPTGVRAKPAPAHNSEPAWFGQWFEKDVWHTVRNRNGDRISYASPDAAIAGAVFSHPTLSKLPPYNILAHDGGGS